MTRINVGYPVHMLCDQHLRAEYRELPRVFGHVPKGYVPQRFTLGRGHVNWCSQFQVSLRIRQRMLCDEMRFRGFSVNFPQGDDFGRGLQWKDSDEAYAKGIIEARIIERLSTMKRTPTWTNRSNPYVGQLRRIA